VLEQRRIQVLTLEVPFAVKSDYSDSAVLFLIHVGGPHLELDAEISL